MSDNFIKTEKAYQKRYKQWRYDVFLFAQDMLDMYPALPRPDLIDKEIPYTNVAGEQKRAKLFDKNGRLVWHDLTIYEKDMFLYQDPKEFKKQDKSRFTWQQTVELEAYNRAIRTFDVDDFDPRWRRITIRSGHGIGKTSFASVVTLHFLWTMPYSQIGATANTSDQLKDIFLKEFYWWKKRMPEIFANQIDELDDKIRIKGTKDWFLRARVSGKDNPEALAGLHGRYILLFADEASGIWDKVFEVMQGALTGDNWIVIMTSNPTRTEGYFYQSHKPAMRSEWTQLHFSSLDSPIVKKSFIDGIVAQYGVDSDEYRVRVLGEFPDEGEMDDKGWIPMFANMNILFEPIGAQILTKPIIGVDPAGAGKNKSVIVARDSVYLKEVLNEGTSSEPDLARKIESVVATYNGSLNDVGIDAFGLGARVISHIYTKINEVPTAILADKPTDEGKELYASYKAELAWKFRQWVANGGIILTNNKNAWLRELEAIRFRRDNKGRIQLMPKKDFKKEFGFSPDRFDAACYTFFKERASKLEEEDMRPNSKWGAEALSDLVENWNVDNNRDIDLSSI